jgi:broad specificity phosphatase PhoE
VRSLVLIPWAETAWGAGGRIVSRTPLPLTDAGRERSTSWGTSLASLGVRVLYSSGEQAADETARILTEQCGARRKIQSKLAEVDAGLWTGLTDSELKRRDAKTFKRWYDDPTSVCPPEGEDLAGASKRLGESLAEVMRTQGDHNVAVVLGPVAFAVSRCMIEEVDLVRMRSMMHNEPMRYEVAANGKFAKPATSADAGGGGNTREAGRPAEQQ